MAGRTTVLIGFLVIVALFLSYSRYQNPEMITPEAFGSIQRLAYGFYLAFAAAIACIAYGLHSYHRQKIAAGPVPGLMYVLASVTDNSRARKVFAATFVLYGVFFALTSGTLVYQPEVDFSYHYGVDVPSVDVIACCDAAGYMPKILVYLSDHVGLQIIPLNVILQMIVSYLVALNVAIVISARSVSKKKKSAAGAGAAAGLFIACPTCVGTLFSVLVGVGGGIVLAAALVHFQTLFIVASIPILALMPFVMASKIARDSCDTV